MNFYFDKNDTEKYLPIASLPQGVTFIDIL